MSGRTWGRCAGALAAVIAALACAVPAAAQEGERPSMVLRVAYTVEAGIWQHRGPTPSQGDEVTRTGELSATLRWCDVPLPPEGGVVEQAECDPEPAPSGTGTTRGVYWHDRAAANIDCRGALSGITPPAPAKLTARWAGDQLELLLEGFAGAALTDGMSCEPDPPWGSAVIAARGSWLLGGFRPYSGHRITIPGSELETAGELVSADGSVSEQGLPACVDAAPSGASSWEPCEQRITVRRRTVRVEKVCGDCAPQGAPEAPPAPAGEPPPAPGGQEQDGGSGCTGGSARSTAFPLVPAEGGCGSPCGGAKAAATSFPLVPVAPQGKPDGKGDCGPVKPDSKGRVGAGVECGDSAPASAAAVTFPLVPAKGRCTGRMRLDAPKAKPRARCARAAAGPAYPLVPCAQGSAAKRIVLARGRFDVRAGKRRTVHLTLTRKARRLLRRRGRLKVRLVVSGFDERGRRVSKARSFTLAKR